MSRYNHRGSPPHLDVRSRHLVYIWDMPLIGGKELKNRLGNQFGWIKFVETLEAWRGAGHLTGDIIIDFSTFRDSQAFVDAVKKGRIGFLDRAGIEHIDEIGSRHFFERIHRNTDVDLLDCDGKPDTDWIRNRRSSIGKPYDRPSHRSRSNLISSRSRDRHHRRHHSPRNETSPSAVRNNNSGRSGGSSSNSNDSGRGRQRDRHSSSDEDDEMYGPFPMSSSSSHRRISNKNGHYIDYDDDNPRRGNHSDIKSRIERVPMVIGLGLTKERMRQDRRQHHRYLRTPSPAPQWLENQSSRRTRPQPLNQINPLQPFSMAFSSDTSFSSGHSSASFAPPANLCSFMFPNLLNNAKRGGNNKKRQMATKGLEPDIILIDDSSEGSNGNGGHSSSFFSTPSAKSNKNAHKKHLSTARKVPRKSSDELEEGELSEYTDEDGIDGGGGRGEEPMEIEAAAGEDEEKPKKKKAEEDNEEEDYEIDIDEYDWPYEFLDSGELVLKQQQQQQPEGESNKQEGEATTGNEQIDSPEANNIDELLSGPPVNLNGIDQDALLDESDDEQQQKEGEEDHQQQKSAKSSSLMEQNPQNSRIDEDEDILVLQVRRISIDKENETAGGKGGFGPIGIGRKGQRIPLVNVKSEIMEEEEMRGEGKDKPMLML